MSAKVDDRGFILCIDKEAFSEDCYVMKADLSPFENCPQDPVFPGKQTQNSG